MLQTMFGPYRIEELLGRGGMGEVYRAHDTETDRTVALKLLPSHLAEDDEYQARFRRECKVAARLNEPHVVPIHRFGEIDGRLYLDMRLVEGSDLSSWLREHGPMPPDVAVAVVTQVAAALDAAHSDGLVHRDVKPSNVLLAGVTTADVEAASVFAYLFDFGIARARNGAVAPDEVSLTMAGVMPGSPSYVAPERFAGVEGDPRADVYALACVLHQALTGRPPFEGDLPSLMRAHLQTPPPKASVLRPGVPSGLDDIVGKGMAKDPEQRYSTAGELASAARAVLGTGSGFHAPPATSQTVSLGDRTVRSFTAPTPVRTPSGPIPAERRLVTSRPTIARPLAARASTAAPRTWTPPPARPSSPLALPPASSSSGSGVLLWVAIVVMVAVVIGGGLLLTDFGRSLTGSSAGTGGSNTGSTSSAPAKPPEDSKLLGGLPAGFVAANCVSDAVMRDQAGALAYVSCDKGPTNGPDSGSFARFSSMDLLEKEFTRASTEAKIPAIAANQTIDLCRTGGTLRGEWGRGEATQVTKANGSIGCFVEATDKSVYLLWTDRDTRGFGYVRRTDGNAAMLYEWWRSANF